MGLLCVVCSLAVSGMWQEAVVAKTSTKASVKTSEKTTKKKTSTKKKTTQKTKKKTTKKKTTKKTGSISPSSLPYKKKYTKKKDYNRLTRQYFTIRSYLEKLGAAGGGTLTLKKGTYKIPCTLYVPSNVTLVLQDGVKLLKTKQTGASALKADKILLETVSRTKAEKKRTVSGYGASRNVKITSPGRAVVDMGNEKGCSGIYIGHANTVTIEGVTFKNKNAGNYILVEGSKNVTVMKCTFNGGKNGAGKKSKMAIRLENIHPDTDTFPEKWGKSDKTLNQGISVSNCRFTGQEIGIGTNECQVNGTTAAPVGLYQTGIRISDNTFTSGTKCAIYAKGWKLPEITGNTMKTAGGSSKTESFIKGDGVADPKINKNTFDGCVYAITFGKAWGYGIGDSVVLLSSNLGSASLDLMSENTIRNCDHYYILNGKVRALYFKDKTEKNFTITPASQPYREHYTNTAKYPSRKMYYLFKSYMEQLEYAGGGTLHVEAGNYELEGNICIPSNVTLDLKNGVTFTKKEASSEDARYAKSLITIVPPSKEGITSSIKGYGGSQNVKIVGNGKAVLNCNYVEEAMGIVMGHAKNVSIQGITFQNGYGSHFVELNSSYHVVVENCTFQNYKVLAEKSYKECINVDGTDDNTKGFNCRWSAHDKTMCQKVYIRKNTFRSIGTAVGTHTYSASGDKLLYHEGVQILNNHVENTYNAAFRVLNWKNCTIQGNTLKNIQSLSDGRTNENGTPILYPAIMLKGVLNPEISKNSMDGVKFYPIVADIRTSPSTPASVSAGYPDTISQISEENYASMRDNTFQNIASGYCYILTRENEMQSPSEAEKIILLGE